MDMLNVDVNKTNLNNDEYVHMVSFMLVKYIQDMHLGLRRPITSFFLVTELEDKMLLKLESPGFGVGRLI